MISCVACRVPWSTGPRFSTFERPDRDSQQSMVKGQARRRRPSPARPSATGHATGTAARRATPASRSGPGARTYVYNHDVSVLPNSRIYVPYNLYTQKMNHLISYKITQRECDL